MDTESLFSLYLLPCHLQLHHCKWWKVSKVSKTMDQLKVGNIKFKYYKFHVNLRHHWSHVHALSDKNKKTRMCHLEKRLPLISKMLNLVCSLSYLRHLQLHLPYHLRPYHCKWWKVSKTMDQLKVGNIEYKYYKFHMNLRHHWSHVHAWSDKRKKTRMCHLEKIPLIGKIELTLFVRCLTSRHSSHASHIHTSIKLHLKKCSLKNIN